MKKVETIKEHIIEKTMEEVLIMIETLKEDYYLPIHISKVEIRLILNEFYSYYEKKNIQYHFFDMMKGHFEDISIMAIEEAQTIRSDYVLEKLKLLELIDSPMEVDPRETKNLINHIEKRLERRPRLV